LVGIKAATSQTKTIKPKTVNKKLKFRVWEDGKILEEFETIEEAREFVFGGD
jgi:hypothetical protein